MESQGKNKRDIIKNILIIFLVIMLLLTFFSNTIMNRSLPEVSTQYASYKQISEKIRASATVSANQDYNIICDEAREISEVHIRRGDRVERGQVIFTLVENESSALSEAKQALNQLYIQKQQMMLDNSSSGDTDYDYEIGLKQEEIEKAEAKLSLVPDYESKLKTLENEVEALEDALEGPNDKLEELNGKMAKYESTYDTIEKITAELEENRKKFDDASKILDSAEATLDEKEAEIDKLEAEIDSLEEENEEYDELIAKANKEKSEYEEKLGQTSTSNSNLLTLEAAMEAARTELRAVEREYAYFTEMQSAKSYLDKIMSTPDAAPEEIAEAQSIYDEAKAKYDDITGGVTRTEGQYLTLIDSLELAEKNATAAFEDASSSKKNTSGYESKIKSFEREIEGYEEKKNENTKAITKLNKQITNLKEELSELTTDKNEAETDKNEAEAKVESGESKLEYAKLRDEADTLKNSIKGQNKQLEKKKEELTELKEDAPGDADELEEKIKLAEREIEVLERKKAADEKNEPYNDEIKKLELANINESINLKQKEIARIQDKLSSTEITSPVSGTVTSVSYTAGEEIEAGSTVAAIAISEKGYTMEFSATNEQCQRINIGDTAELQRYYYGNEPEVRVTAFKNDPSNPGRGKIVVLSVIGDDITVGQTLNFTLGDKTRSYDKVVPNSAVREDSNGKFVLVVDSKSTPLGNRYTARRVEVEIVTSDETHSALSGELLGGEFIITTSSAPVSDGMQVRLADKS